MADETLKFPSGADIKRSTMDTNSKVEVKARAIMLAISASSGKTWNAADFCATYQSIYEFLTEP